MKKVYLMQAGDYYKIGISDNPERRKNSIQTSNANEVTLLATKGTENANCIESKLHNKLKPFNTRGEWFDLTDKQVKEIKNNWGNASVGTFKPESIMPYNPTNLIVDSLNCTDNLDCGVCSNNGVSYVIRYDKHPKYKNEQQPLCGECKEARGNQSYTFINREDVPPIESIEETNFDSKPSNRTVEQKETSLTTKTTQKQNEGILKRIVQALMCK